MSEPKTRKEPEIVLGRSFGRPIPESHLPGWGNGNAVTKRRSHLRRKRKEAERRDVRVGEWSDPSLPMRRRIHSYLSAQGPSHESAIIDALGANHRPIFHALADMRSKGEVMVRGRIWSLSTHEVAP